MESRPIYKTLPCAALVCAFTVADSLILMPLYEKSILPFFAAAVIGVLYITLMYKPLYSMISIKNKIIKGTIGFLAAVAGLVAAYFAAKEYTGFIYDCVLTHENMFLIKLIFAFCAFFLAQCENSAIYKFSVLSVLFSATIFMVLFFTSSNTFDIKNLQSAFSTDDISIKQITSYFSKLFLPATAAVLFIVEDPPFKNILSQYLLYGSLLGVLLSAVVIFDSILSFSLPLAAKLTYPYIDDISTVTIGSLYTRMDGFAYFVFFACYVLKCGVLIRLSASLICRLGIKNKKVLIMLFSALLLL